MTLVSNIKTSVSDTVSPVLSAALLLLVSSKYARTYLSFPSLSWKELGALYIGGQITRIGIEIALRQAGQNDDVDIQGFLSVACAVVSLSTFLYSQEHATLLQGSSITIGALGLSSLSFGYAHLFNTGKKYYEANRSQGRAF